MRCNCLWIIRLRAATTKLFILGGLAAPIFFPSSEALERLIGWRVKRTKYKFGQALRVAWHDSMRLDGWKYKPTEIGEVGKMMTIGYVVNTTDEALAVTSSIGHLGGVLDALSIPWSCIVNVEELGEEWNRA